MPSITANGIDLEWTSLGAGEPVVFVHGVLISSAFAPVASHARLSGYRCVSYARRGYAGSSRVSGPTSIEEQAEDCVALVRSLGLSRVHLVGQSYGGAIGLEVALAAPDLIQSLSVFEPALLVGRSAEGYAASLADIRRRADDAGDEVAVHEFLESRSPGYRQRLDLLTPGAFEQAVADARTTWDCELPSVLQWSFDRARAESLRTPTLVVLGERSRELSPRFQETFDALRTWLPNNESVVLRGATHLPQYDDAGAVADALASFLQRHPLR